MKELTKAEEQIMQVLWQIERGVIKDVLEQLPTPKPAYNTVSTIVRILETKGFVSHKAYGKTHEYFPIVEKDVYMKFMMKTMVHGYFGGSFKKLVSFFVDEKNVSMEDLDEILKHIKQPEKEQK